MLNIVPDIIEIASKENSKSIFLGYCNIQALPIDLLCKNDIQSLDIRYNQIKELPKEICLFKELESINVKGNNLEKLPEELIFLPNLKELDCSENPLVSPPIEIAEKGLDAIRRYFEDLKEERQTVNEAKLIIVGQGAVGKTWLLNRLVYNKIKKCSSTEGVDITRWKFQKKKNIKFRVNFWDFGGQEIYHATHQFFLSERSLYLFVWDARQEDHLQSFDYWLNITSLLSKRAPILIVMNKIDERIKNIDEESLLHKYPNIIGFFKVSAKTGEGILNLKNEIKKQIVQLPHIGDILPSIWIEFREKLESLSENYIDINEYYEIATEFELSKEKALFLSSYFHDIGVFLHFQDNPILKNILFLNPKWATNAVYTLTDSKVVIRNYGYFNFEQLEDVWKAYQSDKYIYLLELIKRFELCFKVPSIESENTYIIPELLPESKPKNFDWDYNNNLLFEIKYDFMPKAIISRLIVINHSFLTKNKFWKNGFVINIEGTEALVLGDILNQKLKFYINGDNSSEVLSILRKDLDYIHKTLKFPNFKEMIPCRCKECIISEVPFYFDYKILMKFIGKGKETITCNNSAIDINIREILGKYNPKQKDSVDSKRIYDLLLEIRESVLKEEDKLTVVNGILQLKPNVFGLGIDINRLFEELRKKLSLTKAIPNKGFDDQLEESTNNKN